MLKNQKHIPVLLNEVLKYLAPHLGETYLDVTAGYGGHALAVLERTKNQAEAVLVDRDQSAAEVLKAEFGKAKILNLDFYTASKKLKASGKKFDMILADLGASSPHFDIASRGFSFSQKGPLDMRMDQKQELTADSIINGYREVELANLIRRYSEDPKAKKIARLIVDNRPVHTTTELAQIVARAWPGYHKVHPATRTFQAVRMEVNRESELLEQSLPIWIDLLNTGGRIVVISFHSLEDRLVKQFFDEHSGQTYDANLKLLSKKPVTGRKTELALNPRARSAKLRAAVKINI